MAKFYRGMYGNRETVDKMNSVARDGFWIIQQALIHDLIRSIYALTDPPKTGNNENLSLRGVLAKLTSVAVDRSRLDAALDQADAAAKEIRVHRTKRLMHFDLKTQMANGANLVPLFAEHLDQAVAAIQEASSQLRVASGKPPMFYDWVVIHSGANAIDWALSDSLRLSELREMAQTKRVSAEKIAEMVKHRSDRNDPKIGE